MTEAAITSSSSPRFSIVSAVYNVEPYLGDFIASIEAQRIPAGDLEVIAVDDGSTDGSLDVLRAWAGRSRHQVHVYTKPNGGQGSARNLGLQHATGEWVTFTDPDDMLDPGYFPAAGRFADTHPDVPVLSARPKILWEATGTTTDAHPRKWQYVTSRVADLDEEPSVFLGLTPGSLFRSDRIRALELTFDTRIRPNFEDAHFAVRYLLAEGRPRVGLVRDMVYVYRKRADGSSTLQGSMRHPGRYGPVLEHGYLDALERARRPGGGVAPWVQQLIVYELSWYLGADEQVPSTIEIPQDGEARFHELWSTVVGRLDPGVVAQNRSRKPKALWLDILAHGYRDGRWHGIPAVDKVDHATGQQRVRYRFTGTQPTERFELAGRAIEPAYAKTRTHRVFGLPVIHERILWLEAGGPLDGWLDDRRRAIDRSKPLPTPAGRRRRSRLLTRLQPARVRLELVRRARGAASRGRYWLLRRLSQLPWYRGQFEGAWVLMDRANNADDNAERLFEHIRANRPDINAWFTIASDATDWRRLRATYGSRVVAWGSLRWRMLMLNCAWLVSSHADRGIVAPRAVVRTEPKRPWKYAFLQHGVIKDDLSPWLNRRDIDMFVVSTAAELESVAGDGSGYVVTHKETRLTGLPRFDRLLTVARSTRPEDRRLLIVAPTWRQGLTGEIDRDTQRRDVDAGYWTSTYHTSWLGLLSSPAIADAVRSRGWTLAFMPHPNMRPILEQMTLPAHVQALSFEGVDVQALYGQCALLVTDYSSVAFNIAYIDRPLVYFQFDREEIERGAHLGKKGYFDYERDGFGPVAETLEAAEVAIVEAIERGPRAAPAYQRRITTTFPTRDGGACARVVEAIEEMSRPWSRSTDRPISSAGNR
ncbi:MAG TPA: glycosyltransferase [Candidatus Limnocylindrales bacterium]|nr:glycosyltransferase [Candidatus Limnocylindrales bacterium]